MKRATWVTAFLFVLASNALLAEAPSAAFLSQRGSGGSCSPPPAEAAVFASTGFGQQSTCSAQATCSPWGHFQYCEGNTSCTAVDRNCSMNEPGHVTCDSATSWCVSCSVCSSCVNYDETCVECCHCDGGPYWFCINEYCA